MTKRAAILLCSLVLAYPRVQVAARAATSPNAKGSASAGEAAFQSRVKPLIGKYCLGCHGEKKKGDLDLRVYTDESAVLRDRKTFAKVMKNLEAHEMPPEKKPQPTPQERALITAWIQSEIFKCDCDHPDPGRITIRRLNRAEYNNTIRDLVGVDFQPADDFPADDSGYGFDNIGDVLSLPPVLLEKYLAAAQKILNKAIVTELKPKSAVKHFEADGLDGTAPGDSLGEGARRLGREGDIFASVSFPHAGEYMLRAKAYGEQAGPEPARMSFSLDGQELKRFDVTVEEQAPEIYELRVPVAAGTHKFSAAYLNNYRNPKDPNPKNRDRNLVIHYLEVEDTDPSQPPVLPETHRRIFFRPATPETKMEAARQIIGRFATRAFRRPVITEEVDRMMKLFVLADRNGESFEQSVKVALQAVLVSPYFLFRGELQPEPNNPGLLHPVDEFALASRLSYFLWNSMPDDELFGLAQRQTLRKNLDPQVRRMLKDPKAKALVDSFAGQWLQIRNLKLVAPDKKVFPDFDDTLRSAMARETELFFTDIMHQDRSILEFLDADYTFVNGRLAKIYGIQGVEGDDFQRVSLKGTHRGGLLTQASILTVTSTPTRTSPVKRGKWVLENILGAPPPPPPPDVPELKEGAALTGTLRQRMEQHRENPMCAACHARMDPIGFGLENFNGIGEWREKEGDFPIDPAGKLVSGESFSGPEDLKTVLTKRKRDDFVHCLTEKMLTYALGRGLEYYDKCAVDQITKRLARNRYRFSALILEIVKSAPFELRRGEEDQLTEAAK
jgi:mono/diheme cytochrome c family protein